MGRLNSAASSVAVPLATSVTSQAASASCERPSSRSTGTPGAWRSSSGSTSARMPWATGSTKRRPGRWRCRMAAAASTRGAISLISERRLPGSSATTWAVSGRFSAARAAARSGSSGITWASGWPT